MVQIRKNAWITPRIIRRVKDITIGSTLSLALLGGMGLMQSCGNDEQNREEETETVYTKGVQTYIEETEKGVFKITDEKTVDPNDSKVFITYLDGRRDTLNLEEARRIVDQRENHNQGQSYHHESGLSNVLFYGGMGYLMGRSFNSQPNPAYYANPNVYQRSQSNATTLSRSKMTKPSNSRSGYFGRSRSGGSHGG
ncbi:MAG: hypothetical protein V4714_01720 [Bacteroidota bacterium]